MLDGSSESVFPFLIVAAQQVEMIEAFQGPANGLNLSLLHGPVPGSPYILDLGLDLIQHDFLRFPG